jgi:hypothetical protein
MSLPCPRNLTAPHKPAHNPYAEGGSKLDGRHTKV